MTDNVLNSIKHHSNAILCKLGNHPHIISFLGVVDCCDSSYLLMWENFHKQNLHSFLDSKSMLNWKMVFSFSLQISIGLAYLHGLSMIHGELNSSNIFMIAQQNKNEFELKLGDVGLKPLKQTIYQNYGNGEITSFIGN